MKMVRKTTIHKKCFVKNLQYYHKSNLVRAPLEALITIYLAEIALMFSEWFVNRNKLEAPQIVLMVFVPLLLALIVCLLYSGGIILLVNKKIYKLMDTINPSDTDVNMKTLYQKIDNGAVCTFRLIHIVGAVCYLAGGIIVSLVLSDKIFDGYDLNNIIILSLYSFFMGIVWNIYGYFSDRRIDWSKIFQHLNINISADVDIQKKKYKYYQRSVNWQIIIIAMITFVLVLVFVRFDYQLMPDKSLDILITYSAFGAWFIAVLKLYCTYTFKLFFARHENGSEIFPSESEILIGHDRKLNKRNHRLKHVRL